VTRPDPVVADLSADEDVLLTESPADPGAVGRTARRALGWSFLNNLVGRVGTSLAGIVLARLLAPEDYGIYAVALVAFNALLSINELGVSLAVIRWPGDVGRIAPTVVTISIAFSAALYAAVWLTAPTVCEQLNAPEAVGVLRLLSAGVMVDALTAVPAALMTREFMQGRRLIVDTAGFLSVSAVSISLAVVGLGAWSLAWGAIAGNIVNGLLILLWAPRRFRPGFDGAACRELLVFGIPLAGASLLLFALLNVDYVVVGKMLGTVPLGLYLLAFNLSTWPVTIFSSPVRRVSLAAFSRLQGDRQAACRAFALSSTLLLAVTLPMCLLLWLLARPLIGLVYGPQWLAASQVLPFLAVLAVARVVMELAYDFLVGLGKATPNLLVNAAWLICLAPALALGAHLDGIRGVAVGHALVAAGVVVPAYLIALHRQGVRPIWVLGPLVRPMLGLVLAAGATWVVLGTVHGPFLQLMLGGPAALLVYGAVVYPMRSLIPSFKGQDTSPPAATSS
jgi:O-antigen/teichoic acid export membrane protein